MSSSLRGGAGIGAALLFSAMTAGCGAQSSGPVQLPDGYPRAQVPVVGELRASETLYAGHPVWRITVAGTTTVPAAKALLAAGLVAVAPGVPLDAGRVGAVYRGHGYTVGISSNAGDVTYVVSPTAGV